MNADIIRQLSVITEEEKAILAGQKDIDKQIYTERKKLVIDCEKLLQKGKLIQIRPHTRFVHFPRHTHNYVEVIYMYQGSTRHINDDDEVILEEGDLLFLNQNAVQEIMPAGEKDLAINLIILPEFFDTAYEMMGTEDNLLRDFLVGNLRDDKRAASYLHFRVADILPIQNLMENTIWSILHDQPNKRSCNQVTMGLLILHLLNHMDKMEMGERSYERDFVVNVLNYVETRYKNGTLSELAELMGCDLYWLSREIKKRIGKTYKELLQTKRMSQAAYLLTNTRIPVSDIIEKVGYDNSSYFYRRFKERYGVSPGEYRDSSYNKI